MSKLVHWEEGLLLRPHHLQRMQKGMLDCMARDWRMTWPHHYGLVEAEFEKDGLRTFNVQFTKLRAVMKNGVVVDYPETAEIEQPLNVRDYFGANKQKVAVYLAVPVWQKERANTLDGSAKQVASDKLLYQTCEESCLDENTGLNPNPLRFRRVRARLMTDAEDRRGYETLELLRLVRDTSQVNAPPQLDEGFEAPTLVLSGSKKVRQLLWELIQLVLQYRDAQARRIKETGFTFNNMQVAHLETVLRLQTLNRHVPTLRSFYDTTGGADGVSLYALYLALSAFLGDLSALRLQHTDFEETPYKHDDAFPVFELICEKIRAFLPSSEQDKTIDAAFWSQAQPAPAGGPEEESTEGTGAIIPDQYPTTRQLKQKYLDLPITCYFLSVETKEDPMLVKAYLENERSFRVLSRDMVDNREIVPGIKLRKPEWTPPSLARGNPGMLIFQFDIRNSESVWQRIRKNRRMAISRIATEQQQFKVDLSKAIFTLRMIPRADED
jgi:type VI secretion system ImpJ/VasE family protein